MWAITPTSVPPTSLTLTPSEIANQTFTLGNAIQPLLLPQAAGGIAPYTYTLLPIPDGLRFDAAAQLLTGTPTTLGTTPVTYTIRDTASNTASLTFTINVIPVSTPGVIQDANLAGAIRRSLGVPANTSLTADVMQQLTILNAYAQGITNLTGLEQATNLTTLDLGANQITDISVLANLTQLTHLYLDDNQIRDVSPLAGLTTLRLLRLARNPIQDTAPLAALVAQNPGLDIDIPVTAPPPPTGVTFTDANLELAVRNTLGLTPGTPLTTAVMLGLVTLEAYDRRIVSLSGLEHAKNLIALDLGTNAIVDVSPLAGLTQLELLYLDNNQIVDVSPLTGLVQLTHLYLDNNQIVDVSPLASLTQLEVLFLTGNPIQSLAPISHLIGTLRVFRHRLEQ